MTSACAIPISGVNIERSQIEKAACLILHVPEWFERADFLDWRQGQALGQWQAPACWHPEERQGENMDVFLVFDRRTIDPAAEEPNLWDGTDIAGLPDDIYAAIGAILAEHGLDYGVLWLASE